MLILLFTTWHIFQSLQEEKLIRSGFASTHLFNGRKIW